MLDFAKEAWRLVLHVFAQVAGNVGDLVQVALGLVLQPEGNLIVDIDRVLHDIGQLHASGYFIRLIKRNGYAIAEAPMISQVSPAVLMGDLRDTSDPCVNMRVLGSGNVPDSVSNHVLS